MTKSNTYKKIKITQQVSSVESHYPWNQGYLPYLQKKKKVKKRYAFIKKHYETVVKIP